MLIGGAFGTGCHCHLGSPVAFTLPFDAAGPLGPAQRCALGAGLAALLAGGVGTAHWELRRRWGSRAPWSRPHRRGAAHAAFRLLNRSSVVQPQQQWLR